MKNLSLSTDHYLISLSNNWQALQIYTLYRFVLSIAILVGIYFNFFPSFVAYINASLFQNLTQAYIGYSMGCALIALIKKPNIYYQTIFTLWLDILFLVLMMHAGGGLLNGLGILLIVVVAAHSILLPGKLALLCAALASSALLTEQVYSQFSQPIPQLAYTQAGLLGLTIFITSIGLQFFSKKAINNQILAKARGAKLAVVGQLNMYVVSHMQSGVIVFTQSHDIELINQAALQLLGISIAPKYVHGLPHPLQEAIYQWEAQPSHQPTKYPIQMHPQGPKVSLSFHALGINQSDILIFINDISLQAKQAQDIKLASLGKLTANIAHELRNPLAAASHAAQLIAESTHLSHDESYLVDIIYQNCNRMNTVIRNVLSLSTHKKTQKERLNLTMWLNEFISEFQPTGIKNPDISFYASEATMVINVDPSQLRQVLVNLFENGLRYSLKKNLKPTLEVSLKLSTTHSNIQLDIQDQGEGVSAEIAQYIFEPFFTTESSGSGLGLYIAKELLELNSASIQLIPSTNGCLLRVTFLNEQGANSCSMPQH